MHTMEDLFTDTLKDIYFAEKQLVKTLRKLSKKAAAPDLQKAFAHHQEETETHVERLEQVFGLIGQRSHGKRCEAIIGIIEEGEAILEEADDPAVRDAGIIAAAQAAEHYEIARYGTLVEWAKLLGHTEAANILTQTLAEEKKADATLTKIAERGVNRAADRAA